MRNALNGKTTLVTGSVQGVGMAKQGYGRVIKIAWVHGLVASIDKAPYVEFKFGLVRLNRVAALEYADAGRKDAGGVTVNCICPGWTKTDIIEPQIQARAAQHGGGRTARISNLLSETHLSRRTTDRAGIAALVLWLCTPIALNVTGTSIPVVGGWTCQ